MPKKYPFEFKAKVVRRYQNGETIKSLAPELYIAQGTLYRWRKEYCSIQGINHTYTPKEFNAISRRLAKLEHEMKIIRLSLYNKCSLAEKAFHIGKSLPPIG